MLLLFVYIYYYILSKLHEFYNDNIRLYCLEIKFICVFTFTDLYIARAYIRITPNTV